MGDRPPDEPASPSDHLPPGGDFEVIDRRGRYVLGAAEDFYGVWDTGAPDRPPELFPLTEEGYQAAERRFIELRRLDRRARGVIPTALRIALVIGVALWVLAGVVVVLFILLEPQARVYGSIYNVVYALDGFGWRLALGSLFLIAGILLLRRERTTRRPESDGPGNVDAPTGGASDSVAVWRWTTVDRVLVAILALGLLAWALSAITTELLFREEFVPPSGFLAVVAPQNRPHFIALFVEALAFRLWVAAAVILGVRWALARWRS